MLRVFKTTLWIPAICVAFMFVSVNTAVQGFIGEPVRVDAQVVGKTKKRNYNRRGGNTRRKLIVVYEVQKGASLAKRVKSSINVSEAKYINAETGDVLTVEYFNSNPGRLYLNAKSSHRFSVWMFLGSAFVFFWWLWFKKWRPRGS